MTVIEIARSSLFSFTPTPVAPGVVCVAIEYYTVGTFWTSTFGFAGTSKTYRRKVLEVIEDYNSKYDKMDSYNDMMSQNGSFWFDDANQLLYINFAQGKDWFTGKYQYGYAFGVTDESVAYINDYCYEPLLRSSPKIEIEADAIGLNKPVGIVGSIVLNNFACIDSVTGKRTGKLDFLLTEPLYRNDVFQYDYNGLALTPVASYYVDNFSASQETYTLKVNDRRFK